MTHTENPSWVALTRGTIEARSRTYDAPPSTTPLTHEQATQRLAFEVNRSLASGATVEYATDTTAVLLHGRRPNHLLHALLTLITFGIWLIVWLALALIAKPARVLLTVDHCGNLTREHIRQ